MEIVKAHNAAMLVAVDTNQTIDDETLKLAMSARAEATQEAYMRVWRDFERYCTATKRVAVPSTPETVADYLTDLRKRGKGVATMQQALAVISLRHQSLNFPTPTASMLVRSVATGVRRTNSTPTKQKTALTRDHIKAVIESIDTSTLKGKRDKALMLFGFAGALRRSELVALTVADIERKGNGIVLHIRRSKTDQEGVGAAIGINRSVTPILCPVAALDAWLEAACITEGALFRSITKGEAVGNGLSDRAVAMIIKERTDNAGLDGDFSGHSLRRGAATTAAQYGIEERHIMKQGRWRSVATVRRYIEEGQALDNPAAKLL